MEKCEGASGAAGSSLNHRAITIGSASSRKSSKTKYQDVRTLGGFLKYRFQGPDLLLLGQHRKTGISIAFAVTQEALGCHSSQGTLGTGGRSWPGHSREAC